jgi:hypothetical protein
LSQSSEGNAVKLTNAKLSGCPKSCFRWIRSEAVRVPAFDALKRSRRYR